MSEASSHELRYESDGFKLHLTVEGVAEVLDAALWMRLTGSVMAAIHDPFVVHDPENISFEPWPQQQDSRWWRQRP